MSRLIFATLLLLSSWKTLPAANPFLPEMDRPIRYSGIQWNSDQGYENSPIEAEGIFSTVAKFGSGEIVRFTLRLTGKPKYPRKFPAYLFRIGADGAIYRLGMDETTHPPKIDPLEIIVPALDESGHFAPAAKTGGDVEITSSESGYRWTSSPWTTEINTDDEGLVRFRSYHPSGHFSRMLWQRGLGITEIGAGQGAGLDGWELHRTAWPAVKPVSNDIVGILAALPAEFFPPTQSFTSMDNHGKRGGLHGIKNSGELPDLNARVEIDRTNGWVQFNSNTDGEGETLDAGLWKRKDGSRLLVLALQKWSAGPTTTASVRAVELRDGIFRHVTTSLPLPTEGDFYKPEEAEKRPPGHLVEGKWILPRKGTTIVIRPPNEEGADLIPESFTSDESYYFELTWDGAEFQSHTLPRIIPPPPFESDEWDFQRNNPTPAALFLRRRADELTGTLQQPGKSIPVSGKIDPDGQAITLTAGGKTSQAKLEKPEDKLALTTSSLGSEEESLFEAIPVDPDAPPLPSYRIVGGNGAFYPQFESTDADWKAINSKVEAFAKNEIEAFKKASKGMKDKDEALQDIVFVLSSRREDTISIVLTVHRYLGGPHGQISYGTFNYDFKTHRFLGASDLLREGWQPKVAKLLNAELVEQGLQEDLITAEMLNGLPWNLKLPNTLSFLIAPESLNSTNVEADLEIPYETLHSQDLIKEGGVLDPHRE